MSVYVCLHLVMVDGRACNSVYICYTVVGTSMYTARERDKRLNLFLQPTCIFSSSPLVLEAWTTLSFFPFPIRPWHAALMMDGVRQASQDELAKPNILPHVLVLSVTRAVLYSRLALQYHHCIVVDGNCAP